VKTAAQLIGEYGDLETLLARAGEIKQEKRRQALIENAERARLSKKLVTLDAHVALEVPLAELAVHEPDYKRLIAFLKAMEFAGPQGPGGGFPGHRARRDRAGWQAQGGPRCRARHGRAARRGGRAGAASIAPASARSRARKQTSSGTSRCAADARGVHAASTRGRPRRGRTQRQDRSVSLRDRAQPRPAGHLDRARARPRRGRARYPDHEPRSHASDAVRFLARARRQRGLLRSARPSQTR